MIVYATSDLHGHLPEVPSDADLLLIAGDVCPDFGYHGYHGGLNKDGWAQRDWLCGRFRDWMAGHSKPICMTWGNHDFVGEKPWFVKDFMATTRGNVWLLNDSCAMIDGLRIWGTPWVPGLPYWAFYAREEALAARAGLIPPDLDVLMTHGPPYGHGDYIPGGTEKQVSKYGNIDGMHVGDWSLSVAIERERPKVTICGHIHEAVGRYDLEGNPVINCAAVDAAYDLRPNPWVRLYELEA